MCNSSNVAVPRYSPGKALGHHEAASLSTTAVNPTDASFAVCSSSSSSSSSTAPPHLLAHDKTASVETTTATNRMPTIQELRGRDNLPASKLPFLIKLHTLLDDVEKTGNDHIISWLSHGLSFKVHRPQALMKVLAPLYFNQTKWKSFQRQLHLYEFARTPYGLEAGSYSHPNFVRGQPDLCLCLRPIKIKGQKKGEGRKVRLPVVFTQPAPPPPPPPQHQQQPAALVGSEMEMTTPNTPNHHLDGKLSPVDSAEHARWVAKIKSLVVNGASLAVQLQQKESSSSQQSSQHQQDQAQHQQQQQQQQQPMFREEALQYQTEQQQSFLPPLLVGSSGNTSFSSRTIPSHDEQRIDDDMMFCLPVETEGSKCVAFGTRSFNFLPLGHDINRCDCCYSGDEGGNDDDDDDDDAGDRFYSDDENISSALKLPANENDTRNNIGSSSSGNVDDDDEDFVQQILAAVE